MFSKHFSFLQYFYVWWNRSRAVNYWVHSLICRAANIIYMKYEMKFIWGSKICNLTSTVLDVKVYLEDVTPVPELDPVLWGAELPVVFVVELDELAFNTWYSSCRFAFSVSNSLKNSCATEWKLVTKTQALVDNVTEEVHITI